MKIQKIYIIKEKNKDNTHIKNAMEVKKLLREYIREQVENVFLLNENIVSENIIKASEFVLNHIVELESEILEQDWKLSTNEKAMVFLDKTYIFSKFLFFKDLWVTLRLIKLNKEVQVSESEIKANNHSSFDDFAMRLTSDKKATKGEARFNIFYKDGDLNNDITLGLIYHEILHYYEHYQRLLKYGEKSFEDLHSVYNIFNSKINDDDNLKQNAFLYSLSTLVYCLCYFERNAFMANLYGELIRVSCDSISCLEGQFKQTSTYNNYYKFLKNPAEIFNEEMFHGNKDDLKEINKIITGSIESYNKINVKNKIDNKDVGFYYKGESIKDYVEKIYKMIAKAKYKTDKKLPEVFKKVLFDREMKVRAINEIDNFYLRRHPNRIMTPEESYRGGWYKI